LELQAFNSCSSKESYYNLIYGRLNLFARTMEGNVESKQQQQPQQPQQQQQQQQQHLLVNEGNVQLITGENGIKYVVFNGNAKMQLLFLSDKQRQLVAPSLENLNPLLSSISSSLQSFENNIHLGHKVIIPRETANKVSMWIKLIGYQKELMLQNIYFFSQTTLHRLETTLREMLSELNGFNRKVEEERKPIVAEPEPKEERENKQEKKAKCAAIQQKLPPFSWNNNLEFYEREIDVSDVDFFLDIDVDIIIKEEIKLLDDLGVSVDQHSKQIKCFLKLLNGPPVINVLLNPQYFTNNCSFPPFNILSSNYIPENLISETMEYLKQTYKSQSQLLEKRKKLLKLLHINSLPTTTTHFPMRRDGIVYGLFLFIERLIHRLKETQ
jgi:hypothetical protein